MKPVHILLIEDNEGDILLTIEAFEELSIAHKISVARDGNEAIDFLDHRSRKKSEELPDLILLDINLPKKNGFEILSYIKGSDALRHLPVIIMTTSSSEKDILQSYQNYANCYITKPIDVGDFMKVIAALENFWIKIVKLPGRN